MDSDQIAFKGQPVRLEGRLPAVGEVVPNVTLVDRKLAEKSLLDYPKKYKIISTFPSLDTSVCSLALTTFHRKLKDHPGVLVLNVSLDLPFAASRYCQEAKMEDVETLSAFRSSFPSDYGVKIAEGPLRGLCARAIFLLDQENRLLYRELVKEVTHEPDYDKVVAQLL